MDSPMENLFVSRNDFARILEIDARWRRALGEGAVEAFVNEQGRVYFAR